MARKRMIDPQFFLDEELAALTPHARLLYIGLWTIADDRNATLPNRPKWIKAQIFPYENVNIERVLDELSTSTHILLFTHSDDQKYWYLPSFHKYQRIDRPSISKSPEYNSKLAEPSTSTRTEVKLKEVKLRETYTSIISLNEGVVAGIAADYSVSVKAVRDLKDDLLLYCKSKGKKYSDYKATLQNWVRRAIKDKKISKIAPSASLPIVPDVSPEEQAEVSKKIKEMRAHNPIKSI